MFLVLSPAPELSSLIQSYWFIEDLPGKYEGSLIRTSPIPLAVLSVNMGRPNSTEDGMLVPRTSLLGIQSCARSWQSYSDTCFVMVMLTVRGIVRLFPHTGPACAGALVDLGTISGDAHTNTLASGVGAELRPQQIAAQLNRWFISRVGSTKPVSELERIVVAHELLGQGASVEAAANVAQVNRRHLHRWYRDHFGIGPKEFSDLERLHGSLRAVQAGRSDPISGFSDQAHQIRSWQHRLGITPRRYVKENCSELASHFSSGNIMPGPAFYL